MLLRGLSSKQEFYKNIVIAFYKSFSKFCNLKLIDLTFRQLSLLSSDKDCWSSAKKDHEQYFISEILSLTKHAHIENLKMGL